MVRRKSGAAHEDNGSITLKASQRSSKVLLPSKAQNSGSLRAEWIRRRDAGIHRISELTDQAASRFFSQHSGAVLLHCSSYSLSGLMCDSDCYSGRHKVPWKCPCYINSEDLWGIGAVETWLPPLKFQMISGRVLRPR
jgi:hypothetical protein